MRSAREWTREQPIMIAGLAGRTAQAVERGADRARPRLSRRAALARRAQGRDRGRADRACAGDRARDPAGRLLSAARGRRHRAAGVVLAPLCGHRQRRRHQDRAVQSLPHARRRARRGRGRRRRPRHALYRQRRSHRARPAHAVHRGGERPRDHRAHQGRAARPLERLGQEGGRTAGPHSRRRRRRQRAGRPARARTRKSPIATRRSSTSPTTFTASSPAATKSCAGRGCSKASGASTRTRRWDPDRRRRSTGSAPPIRTSTTMRSCARICERWLS